MNNDGKKLRILIIDDHPLLRRGVSIMLRRQADFEVVGEGCDGVEAVEMAGLLSADVIIMDLDLPKKSGIQAIAEIVKENPEARILAFSGLDDDDMVLAAIQAGAVGFLAKASDETDIVKAIRDIYHGRTLINPCTLRQLLPNVQMHPESILNTLTKREREIIEMIANGGTNQHIAEVMLVTNSTVRSHINHIINKLGLKSRIDMVRLMLLENPQKNITITIRQEQ